MRARDPIAKDIKLMEQKHQQLEKKNLSLKIDLGGIAYGLVSLLKRLKRLKLGKKVRQKQLWIDNIYINENYSERIAELRM